MGGPSGHFHIRIENQTAHHPVPIIGTRNWTGPLGNHPELTGSVQFQAVPNSSAHP